MRSEGAAQYDEMAKTLAGEMDLDVKTLERASKQLQSVLTTYCEDTALAVVDSLEDHGPLAGFETWRRLWVEQRGTLTQRTDSLRDKVVYPEKVALADVTQAITSWEKS